MSVFAYFVPGLTIDKADDKAVEAVGLRPRLADCFGKLSRDRMVRQNLDKGPSGGQGTLIVPQRVDEAEIPLWSAAKWDSEPSDNGKFWITWMKDQKPGPAALRRRSIVEGVPVEMLDGNSWICPTIRKALCIPQLPCCYSRRNGQVSRAVVPEYRDLWEASGTWAASYFSGQMPDADLFGASAQCLAVNYRLGDEELSILGLFDGDGMVAALEAALDVQFFVDAKTDQKKRGMLNDLLAAVNSTPGAEDSIPNTESAAAS